MANRKESVRTCDQCGKEKRFDPDGGYCGGHPLDGCSCHEKGWQNKWESAVEMAARATVERDEWREKAEKLAVTCYTWEDNWKLAVQDNSTRKENNFALHRRNMRLNAELTAAKCTLAKWIEWARMHGHIDHAAGIADDSRRLISSEND